MDENREAVLELLFLASILEASNRRVEVAGRLQTLADCYVQRIIRPVCSNRFINPWFEKTRKSEFPWTARLYPRLVCRTIDCFLSFCILWLETARDTEHRTKKKKKKEKKKNSNSDKKKNSAGIIMRISVPRAVPTASPPALPSFQRSCIHTCIHTIYNIYRYILYRDENNV